jgi:hypothetical protein
MNISSAKRTRNTSNWSAEHRHARIAAALAARGLSPVEREKDMDELLRFLVVVGYSIPAVLADWIGKNGASIVTKALRDGLIARQPNTIKTTKRVVRHAASIVVVQLLVLTKAGFDRARKLTNTTSDRVKSPSNRYVRHDLIAQIRSIRIKQQMIELGKSFELFSRKNQENSVLLKPGIMLKFIPDLWFEYQQNQRMLGVFVEVERSAKSDQEMYKFGHKLDFLSDHGQVLVFFEREISRVAFLRKGFEKWSDFSLISAEDCAKRRIRFLVLTPENLAYLP